ERATAVGRAATSIRTAWDQTDGGRAWLVSRLDAAYSDIRAAACMQLSLSALPGGGTHRRRRRRGGGSSPPRAWAAPARTLPRGTDPLTRHESVLARLLAGHELRSLGVAAR